MKKTLLLIITLLTVNFGFAQLAKKHVLIEQFTQASCGPCAAENPSFRTDILIPNVGKVHHIAYHTSWPGVDPMYNRNTVQNTDRVTFYGVTGVPTFETMGKNIGVTTQEAIDAEIAKGSPVGIEVTQTVNGSNLDVKIKVVTVGTIPAGTYKLRAMIVEDPVVYTTPPGSNGEKYFPNVFRRTLPNSAGDTYVPAAKGDSVVFNYSYAIDTIWNMSNIHTTAFIQNASTKEVLNSGSSLDGPITIIMNGELTSTNPSFVETTAGSSSTYTATVSNFGTAAENFKVKLLRDEPANWVSTFEINGTAYSDSAVLSIPANTSLPANVTVTPGATPAIATYQISMQSVDNPTIILTKTYRVISGVTDLVVSNTGLKGGTGPEDASAWESSYTNALALNTASYAATSSDIFIEAGKNNMLSGVKNIYYNIGWSFPGLTDENTAQLTTFINNGGNLFIAGQDLGWDSESGSGSGTPTTKAFYKNYLNAKYVSDGTPTNTPLTANPSDDVFGSVSSSAIFDYYGGANVYPELITPLNGAEPIFFYKNDSNKIAGLKSVNTSGSKVVYLGVGLEMLTDLNVQQAIMKQTYDWFYGAVTVKDIFETEFLNLYPNPAKNTINIQISEHLNELKLYVINILGEIVYNKTISANTTVDVSSFNNGMYIFQLTENGRIIANKKIVINH